MSEETKDPAAEAAPAEAPAAEAKPAKKKVEPLGPSTLHNIKKRLKDIGDSPQKKDLAILQLFLDEAGRVKTRAKSKVSAKNRRRIKKLVALARSKKIMPKRAKAG